MAIAPNPALGVLLHAVGGLAAGSFYLPLKKVRNWAWESYWLIQGVAAWIIAPLIGAALTVPDFMGAISRAPGGAVFQTFLYGALWGIGGLTFGLSMRYLGLSLGYALALGFCAAFGTMIPPLVSGDAGKLFTTASGLTTFGGVVVCLLGIAVCCFAGMLKEKDLTPEQQREAIKEFALTKGLLVAIFAGIMSACMAFAITAGQPIADQAVKAGAQDIFKNNAVMVVALAGGFATNFVWCLVLGIRNKSLGDFVRVTDSPQVSNFLFAAAGGVVWYLQFFFYGMGTTQLGAYNYASWTIHMAFIIVFSNLWALSLHEWKGSKKRTLNTIYAGLAVLVGSTIVIGVGNFLALPQK